MQIFFLPFWLDFLNYHVRQEAAHMFWDNVAWVYDLFANGINRKANRALCEAVAQMIQSEDCLLYTSRGEQQNDPPRAAKAPARILPRKKFLRRTERRLAGLCVRVSA